MSHERLPTEKSAPPAVHAGGRELTEQLVRIPFRILAGIVALAAASGAVEILAIGVDTVGDFGAALVLLCFAAAAGWLALRGVRQPVVAPEASARFLELADPARPLPPSIDPPKLSDPSDDDER